MQKLFLQAFIGLLFLISALSVLAHTEVNISSPSDGAVLNEPPKTIHLNFPKNIRLTKVSLSIDGKEAVDLDLSEHKEFKKDFELPVGSSDVGQYFIEWRGLGTDGHAIEGEFLFAVE